MLLHTHKKSLHNISFAQSILPTKLISSFSLSFLFISFFNFYFTLQYFFMEDRKEKTAPWLSVPQFGDWDQKGELPDYSMDFTKIREMRKQNKRDASRASLGNEEDFINPTATNAKATHNDHHHHHDHYHQSDHHPPNTRRSFFSYFNCCVKA